MSQKNWNWKVRPYICLNCEIKTIFQNFVYIALAVDNFNTTLFVPHSFVNCVLPQETPTLRQPQSAAVTQRCQHPHRVVDAKTAASWLWGHSEQRSRQPCSVSSLLAPGYLWQRGVWLPYTRWMDLIRRGKRIPQTRSRHCTPPQQWWRCKQYGFFLTVVIYWKKFVFNFAKLEC